MTTASIHVRRLLANANETRVVELTASGRGAICVLAVCGVNVPEQIGKFFDAANGKPLLTQPTMKPVYGRWNDEDIIVCVHNHTYVEVHCHGGDFAKQRIIANLASIGFQKSDLPDPSDQKSTADAAMLELARATTRKSAAVLTWQSEGALDDALCEIDQLVSNQDFEQAARQIESLLKFAQLGLHLTNPWQIAIAGAANAGKSSLINQIVGYGRSIVMDMPGTTRDLVTVETAIAGWPVRLIDTAGLRKTDDQIEQAGVALAEAAIKEAELVIEVIDSTCPASSLQGSNVIRVWNKSDLAQPSGAANAISITAITGKGVSELLETVAQRLVPVEPSPGCAVPFLPGQINDLKTRLESVTNKA